jgi:hypothetical protein
MEILRKETYVKMIENAVGTRLFNSLMVREDGAVRDLLNDGEYSCAIFTSGVLLLNQKVARTRTTVTNLEADLLASDQFSQIPVGSEVQPGDVVLWEKVRYEDGSENRHIGFAVSQAEAVSTNYVQKCVVRHPLLTNIENTGEVRKIERIFRPVFQ